MAQAGHTAPRFGNLRQVKIGKGHTGLGAAIGQNLAPRCNHKRMAIGVAALAMGFGTWGIGELVRVGC